MKFDLNKWLVVIPARLESTRLMQKPLQPIQDRPLIGWVYERIAELEEHGAKVVVAVDDELTQAACEKHQIPFAMTAKHHKSGSDRVAEVSKLHPERDFVLNVQGDEPNIESKDLLSLMRALEGSGAEMGTLVFPTAEQSILQNPNRVKAVVKDRFATDFFRQADAEFAGGSAFFLHVGVYAFTKSYLKTFCGLPPSQREQDLRLEQMRALDSGTSILAAPASSFSTGIDTFEDLEAFREQMKSKP
jgi:3-deoxy-manno-octulosonate cytidylyltransferase (CMP-KDO synthetase)